MTLAKIGWTPRNYKLRTMVQKALIVLQQESLWIIKI